MATEFTQGRPTGPAVALTPRFRCGHGAGGAVREADEALVTGRPGRALDAYLRLLADHPRSDFCDRVLYARAAEAALAARCPRIAHDVAAAAIRRTGDQPVGADAVLTVRSLALWARALLALDRTEAAAAALRRAQNTTQRDTAVDLLVRLTAAEIHLAQEAPFDDLDTAIDRLTSMLSRHDLNPSEPGVLPPLLIGLGRLFVRQGRLQPAREAFDLAGQHTAVTGWVARKGMFAVFDQHPESDRRWRYAAADWAEALCEEAHCRAAMRDDCSDSDAPLVFRLAAISAANRGDAETAARLSACRVHLEQVAGGEPSVWAVPHEPEANFLFLFADEAAQRRWAALHEGVQGIHAIALAGTGSAGGVTKGETSPLAWWAGRSDAKRLRDAARSAHEVFARLHASAPETFGAMYDRVGRTISVLDTLIGGEPIDGSGGATGRAAGPEPRQNTAPEPDHVSERRAESVPPDGDAAKGTTTTRPTPAKRRPGPGRNRPSGFPTLPTAVPSPYKNMTTSIPRAERPQPGALPLPPWLDEEIRAAGARCWVMLTAAAEAHRLGHGQVGSEHLLLAVCEDGDCAGLLRPLGITVAEVRSRVTDLVGPDPDRRSAVPLSARARTVLALAGVHARHQGTDRIRPVHVLSALALEGRSVGAHLLTLLGADHDELLSRVRLHTASHRPADATVPSVPTVEGLPSLARFTTAARRTVTRAASWAAASTGGLLDHVLLLRAAAAEGWEQTARLPADGNNPVHPLPPATPSPLTDPVPSPGAEAASGTGDAEAACTEAADGPASPPHTLPHRVLLTPAARRVLVAASADAARRGHPGVDLDDLRRTIFRDHPTLGPPGTPSPRRTEEHEPTPDAGARNILATAHAQAVASGHPYIGPEHLRSALDADAHGADLAGTHAPPCGSAEGRRHYDDPLPLTPRATRALAVAAATARSAGRESFTVTDLMQGLSDVAPTPDLRPQITGPPPSASATTDNDITAGKALQDAAGQRFHTTLVRYLERALGENERKTSRLLARGHSEDGDEAEYRRRLQELRDVQEEQLEVLRLLCRHDPTGRRDRLIEALLATARRRRDDPLVTAALDEATRLARQAPRSRPEQTWHLARTLAEIGTVHQEAGRNRGAIALYDEALGQVDTVEDPDGRWEAPGRPDAPDLSETPAPQAVTELRGWALAQRAQCLAAEGPEAETTALLRVANHQRRRLTTDQAAPQSAQVTADLGRIAKRLNDLGRYDRALVVASGAIDAVGSPLPELAIVHDQRAWALLQLNRGDLGRRDLDDAVRLAPEDAFHVTRRGIHLLRTGRIDEAIADFDRALALSPTYTLPRHRRGEAHLRAGRHRDALADLDAVLLVQDSAAAFLARGQTWRALGDPEAALRDHTTANAADPDCSWTRYEYGLTLFATGATDRARRQIGEAIRQERASYEEPTPWRFTSAANLAVLHTALGAERQAHRWLSTAFNYRNHPWMVTDFHHDLEELSRTLPDRSGLCTALTRVASPSGRPR
ncbi:Clp protease N-terminal domain-containing protein [Streptomyces sp. NPDC057298]|uniref:tetratricopeptide repeat protein n=1 Tax=Streptomyces sp. NPDC057298 TaxID=3346091 RepID=UPI003625AF07